MVMSGFMDLPWSTGLGYLIGFITLAIGIIYGLLKRKGV
jgi:hypothetical protein